MKRTIFIFLALIALFTMQACEEEIDQAALQAEEGRYFDLYMDANYPDLQARESGLYFIEYKVGTGAMADSGDWVLINYLAYTIPDEVIVDTYDKEWAQDYNLYNESVMYGPYKYQHGTEILGMREGVSLMKEGGIARLIFKSDLGYGSNGYGNIGKFTSLMYDIQLEKVIGDADAYEKQQISAYLLDHPEAVPIYDDETEATMYYIPGVEGDSTQLEDGSTAHIFYKGTLLDGRVFDSNEDSKSGFKVTIGDGDVIKGWEIGLKNFKYGGTGQLLIPHELAYGANGSMSSGTNKYSIPPYEALLFDIEVSKFTLDTK